MFRWRMREVLLTQDAGLFGAVQDALSDSHIPYDTRIINTGSQNRRSGGWGRIGENVNLEILYYIYVKPKYEEEAEYVVAECRSRMRR